MSKKVDLAYYEKFLQEAKDTEIDLLVNKEKTIKFLKLCCLGFFSLAALGVGGVVTILPLKEPPIPYILKVDSVTGRVDSLNLVTPESLSQMDSAVDYFIRFYVKNRESYSAENIQTYYDTTIEMSDEEQARAWDKKFFDGKNAIDKVLGNSVSIEVEVKDVIPDYKNNKAVVRFIKRYVYDNKQPVTEYWSADLSWYFDTGTVKVSQRAINPLRMKVDDYRSSQEISK